MAGITWLIDPIDGLDEPIQMWQTEKETVEANGQTATVQLRCPWSQRYGVFSNILTNYLPWPYRPNDGLFAVTGSIDPFPGEAGIVTDGAYGYEDALLTINFQTAQGNGGGGNSDIVIFSESIEPTAHFFTISGKNLRWGSAGGLALEENEYPGRLIPGLDYKLTYFRMSRIPAAFFTLIGHVNSNSVFSSFFNYTFPPETLLYNPPVLSPINVTGLGGNLMNLTVRFTLNPDGWNTFPRSNSSGGLAFESIYHKDGSGIWEAYPSANMAGALP